MKLNQDRVAGVILLLICTGLFYEGWRYPADSRLFPLGLLAFLMIGAIVMIVRPAEAFKGERGEPKKILLTTVLCIAYVALVEIVGFFVSTALFMAAFMLMVGIKRPLIYIAAIVGVNLGLYLLFVWQLKVPIPIGILFQ
jgi:putative tricarboxylic transport membrane protein